MLFIIEDDIHVLEIYQSTFKDRETRFFSCAEDALASIQQGAQPRILLTDYNLIGMNGLQLIEMAKQYLPHIKCLLISGNPPENIHESINLICKPVRPSRLLKTVNNI